jgi:hypothetical protein
MQYYDLTVHHSAHAAAPAGASASPAPATSAAAPAKDSDTDFSFGDLIDIVNPLQHIPVVGTLYRAITGDTIKTPEKIAGDTLYGGVWGFVSSVADAAFQSVTGKNVGDTVLAFLTGDDGAKATQIASAAQAPKPAASQTPASQPASPDVTALDASLTRSGTDSDLAQRAVYAYRRAYGLMRGPELAPL